MKAFAMLKTGPIADGCGIFNRWYIDGKRVSKKDFYALRDVCVRQDTFHSYTRRGRHYARSVCYR